jgi:serine/threonine protein phosphatase 1
MPSVYRPTDCAIRAVFLENCSLLMDIILIEGEVAMEPIWAVGDVHGCSIELIELLGMIDRHPLKGKIVFLGDYVARGPDSRGVLDIVMQETKRGNIALLGNHDLMLANAYNRQRLQGWDVLFGRGIFQSFGDIKHAGEIPSEYIDFINNLQCEYDTQDFMFCHTIGIRVPQNKVIVCGHDSNHQVVFKDKLIRCDTGAGSGGKLSAVECYSHTVISVDCPHRKVMSKECEP